MEHSGGDEFRVYHATHTADVTRHSVTFVVSATSSFGVDACELPKSHRPDLRAPRSMMYELPGLRRTFIVCLALCGGYRDAGLASTSAVDGDHCQSVTAGAAVSVTSTWGPVEEDVIRRRRRGGQRVAFGIPERVIRCSA